MDVITHLPRLPARPEDGHKGTFGHLLVIAGSTGMSGAAVLAGRAALRGGAGLVTMATPATVAPIVAANEPSYLTISLPQDKTGHLVNFTSVLSPTLDRMTAIAIGPGLGQSPAVTELVSWIMQSVPIPVIADADALNAIARRPAALARDRRAVSEPRILTPHPGEFARLAHGTCIPHAGSSAESRAAAAAAMAREFGCLVVLKGNGTVVTDGQQLAINRTGGSALAKGGTGDVLTGLMGSLLAQRMCPFDAAVLAVHVHGLAGDLAAKSLSSRGVMASDLPDWITQAWLHLEANEAGNP